MRLAHLQADDDHIMLSIIACKYFPSKPDSRIEELHLYIARRGETPAQNRRSIVIIHVYIHVHDAAAYALYCRSNRPVRAEVVGVRKLEMAFSGSKKKKQKKKIPRDTHHLENGSGKRRVDGERLARLYIDREPPHHLQH